MAAADYWVDWSFRGSVGWARRALPELARAGGFSLEETRTVATGEGWGSFAVGRDGRAVGVARIQDMGAGRAQAIVAPAAGAADAASVAALNAFAVLLYSELVRAGRLDPPPPLRPIPVRGD